MTQPFKKRGLIGASFDTYVNRTHHAKEEDLLLRELRKRPLSAENQRAINELIKEHVFGRQTTKAPVTANTRYQDGNASPLADIAVKLRAVVEFYPKHIKKEVKVFFPASNAYFTDKEDQDMLAEFWEFDWKMINEKYRSVVKGLEGQ